MGDCLFLHMVAILDDYPAVDRNVLYHGVIAREQPAIEDFVRRFPNKSRVIPVEKDEIGIASNLQSRVPRTAERLMTAGKRRRKNPCTGRMGFITKDIALLFRQALPIFQQPDFFRQGYIDVTVRPERDPSAVVKKLSCGENAITEICLRDRAKTRNRLGLRDCPPLLLRDVSGMNETPAIIKWHVFGKPFNGTCTRPVKTIRDLFLLLGNMYMTRHVLWNAGEERLQ